MDVFDRMQNGYLYRPEDPNLGISNTEQLKKQRLFNQTADHTILKRMFAAFGDGSQLRPPLFSVWGGQFVEVGRDVKIGPGLTLVDDAPIIIGDRVQIGASVTISVAGHPVDPTLRRRRLAFNLAVHLDDDCVIGDQVIILPGVTIGKGAIIEAGSIVTKDIPAHVVAAGNPCRVIQQVQVEKGEPKMAKSEFEKMRDGSLYLPEDPAILAEQQIHMKLQYQYNNLEPGDPKQAAMLKKMFADCGEECYIEPPLHANWGGFHTHLGDRVYANFNLTLVDDADIYIGDDTMIGPNVNISTAGHPIWPAYRLKKYQHNQQVHIGKNCWLGANVTVLPGVTIGDNTVVGAGSVVTKDLPANVVAVGNPCRVLREINDHDRQYYYKDRRVDLDE